MQTLINCYQRDNFIIILNSVNEETLKIFLNYLQMWQIKNKALNLSWESKDSLCLWYLKNEHIREPFWYFMKEIHLEGVGGKDFISKTTIKANKYLGLSLYVHLIKF